MTCLNIQAMYYSSVIAKSESISIAFSVSTWTCICRKRLVCCLWSSHYLVISVLTFVGSCKNHKKQGSTRALYWGGVLTLCGELLSTVLDKKPTNRYVFKVQESRQKKGAYDRR